MKFCKQGVKIMPVVVYPWVRTCCRRCCELSAAFTAAAGAGELSWVGAVVPKGAAGPFPVVWGEPVQEPWLLLLLLLLKRRGMRCLLPLRGSQDEPDGLSHP